MKRKLEHDLYVLNYHKFKPPYLDEASRKSIDAAMLMTIQEIRALDLEDKTD